MNFSRISSWASGFQKTEDKKPSSPATHSAPQPIDPKQLQADRKMSFGSGAGSAMRNRLSNAFPGMTHSTGSRRGSGKVDLNSNVHLFAAYEAEAANVVQIASYKLARDKAAIGGTLDGWAAHKSASLESELRPFIQAEKVKQASEESRLKKFFTGGAGKKGPEDLANDSLRSAMTAVNTIKISRSPERKYLQMRAESLSSAVIFNAVSYEGGERIVRPFNLQQFATQGSLRAIDGMNIPSEERREIASRLKTALHEIDALNRAFVNNEMYPPDPKFDPKAVVSVLVEEVQAPPHGGEQLPPYTPYVGAANAYQPAAHARYGQPLPNVAPPPYPGSPAPAYPKSPPPAYTPLQQGHPQAQMRPLSPSGGAAPWGEPSVLGLKRSMATRNTSRKEIADLKRQLENATNERDEGAAYLKLDNLSKNNPQLADYLARYDPLVVRTPYMAPPVR